MTVKYAKESFLVIKGLGNWENYVCWLPGSGIGRDNTCKLTCTHVSIPCFFLVLSYKNMFTVHSV